MQIKRSVAPRFWPIERKTKKYAMAPEPGPHAKEKCLPLGIALRDMLHYARTSKEAQALLNKGLVKVDGRARKSNNFPVGIMDVLTVGEENYRILPNRSGFYLQGIDDSEARIKPEKIVSKTVIKKGKIQLNLFDGRNVLADKGEYATGDTAVLDTQKNAVVQLLKMRKGAIVLVIGGKNVGKIGSIEDIAAVKMQAAQVTIDAGGEKIFVPKDYVFVVGEKEPVIKIGE